MIGVKVGRSNSVTSEMLSPYNLVSGVSHHVS